MNKNIKHYLIFILLAIIAYWQVSFFQNTLKWDMIDCYLPWRSFVSECLQHRYFPLWNPYQDFGYPIHADMRTIWAPEIWLVTLLGGYSIYSFSILFILYTSIAGIGMKLLSNFFIHNDKAAFFSGAVYMLSGYLTAHGQELSTINSFAFIPIVLYQYLKFQNELSWKRAVYFTLAIFVLLTSAYQAHSFILLYLLIILFAYFAYKFYKKQHSKELKKIITFHFIFIFVIGIVFTPVIISAYQVLPWVSRLNSGVDYSTISILSFSPQSLLSLILPFAVIRNINFFNTDLSMTNLYFGIIPLILVLFYFFSTKKSTIFSIIFGFGLFALIASFGDYTPLRKILFDYVPFMNLFKGSAYFRLFTLISFCMASGYVATKFEKHKRKIILLSLAIIVIISGFVAYSISNIDFSNISFFNNTFSFTRKLEKHSTFYENIFIQGLIQLVFIIAFLLIIIYKKANFKYIAILTISNLILAVQMNIYATTISKYKPKNAASFLESLPNGFPIPDKSKLISECSDKSMSKSPFWRNTNTMAKRVSGDGFNSFKLDKTQNFKTTYKYIQDTITQNELLYFSNNIKPLSDINVVNITTKTLFIADSIFNKYKYISDTNTSASNKYEIIDFGPNKLKTIVYTDKATFLTLLQTNYSGWEVKIDGQPAQIIESNKMFISLFLKSGKHKVEFKYQNKLLIHGFIVSSIFLLLLIIAALYFLFIDNKRCIYETFLSIKNIKAKN